MFLEEVETDSTSEGTIIYQSRRKDTLIVRGVDLTIKIAVKPKEIESPVEPTTPEEDSIGE